VKRSEASAKPQAGSSNKNADPLCADHNLLARIAQRGHNNNKDRASDGDGDLEKADQVCMAAW
jgi:hypothetical protein